MSAGLSFGACGTRWSWSSSICDGVLVDSERLAVRVEAQSLNDLGLPLTEADVIERFVGRNDSHMRSEIEIMLGRPIPEWQERYESSLHAAFDAELVEVDGISAALDALDDAGIATCVASSGTHEKMRRTLGRAGLYRRFDRRSIAHLFSR